MKEYIHIAIFAVIAVVLIMILYEMTTSRYEKMEKRISALEQVRGEDLQEREWVKRKVNDLEDLVLNSVKEDK